TRSAREFVYTQLQREKLEAVPGQQAVYSDLGFMLLGAVIEEITGLGLDQYCRDKIFRPLGLQWTAFLNLEMMRRHKLQPMLEKFAPTERCPWRKRVLCAEVHDDNAYAMGGVAGHAGLFSTVDDLDRLVSCLTACYRGESTFLPSALVHEFWTRDGSVPGSTWTLGWDTPSPEHSSAGELFSPQSVGHLGFTGTSLWIDLEQQVHVIVLSNRVHPRRDNDKIQAFRPVLHNAIMQAVRRESSQQSVASSQ
ncbi:MAG: serine hydrolase, partial [Deltaproteobacteria bacterium]|nr:serine hydrolase [Deltaproteobacteria bacterium]